MIVIAVEEPPDLAPVHLSVTSDMSGVCNM